MLCGAGAEGGASAIQYDAPEVNGFVTSAAFGGGFPDGVRVEDGHVTLPDLPGIGFEGKSDLIRAMRALAE